MMDEADILLQRRRSPSIVGWWGAPKKVSAISIFAHDIHISVSDLPLRALLNLAGTKSKSP